MKHIKSGMILKMTAIVFFMLLISAGMLQARILNTPDRPSRTAVVETHVHDHQCCNCDDCETLLGDTGSPERLSTCPSCGGSKKCHVCGGSGRNLDDNPCSICNGTGRCYYCDGKGKI
ncbi:MAG: hypothetical protein M1269_04340 [Chloroflexi bacterium]|nr:hypothetical protein [Chloroflexota bacterium]